MFRESILIRIALAILFIAMLVSAINRKACSATPPMLLVAPAAVHAPCTPMAYTYDASGAHLVCNGVIFIGGFE